MMMVKQLFNFSGFLPKALTPHRLVPTMGLALTLAAGGLTAGGCADGSTGTPEPEAPETEPDTGEPDTGEPDTGEPDTGEPDTGEPDTGEPEPTPFVEDTYNFESRFNAGENSVVYSGQVNRHALIASLKSYIGNLDDTSYPAGTTPAEIVADLNYLYDYKNEGGTGDDPLPYNFDDATVQATFGDIGSPASLFEKMPDQDAAWTTPVIGYGDDDLLPTEAVNAMFLALATNIAARADGTTPTDPSGAAIPVVYVTADGVDHQQLIQKFLDGAVTYSQASDDYLDDDLDDKGLNSDNTAAVDGKPYTGLEHVWDEGFGYFGAARNALLLTDEEIAAGAFDANADGEIDVKTELNQGHSLNASKRDLGAVVATDFSHTALSNFLDGRALIADAGGALSTEQMDTLKGHRDAATKAWEDAISATAIHYINDVLADMNNFGTEDYSFVDHAKHWSELKGFALALQFNPRKSLTDAQFAEVQTQIGNAPVLEDADTVDIDAYAAALRAARATIGEAQGFASENLGDDVGANGW